MHKYLSKVIQYRWILRSILSSVYFNFRLLPIRQACKLPILLYKPKFSSLEGKITILGKVKFGMIQLGYFRVPFYPNNGIRLSVDGNLIFHGFCNIGNNSVLSVSPQGVLSLGKSFSATAALKLTCSNEISFGDHVTIGWDNIFMDSDFHRLTKCNMGDCLKTHSSQNVS